MTIQAVSNQQPLKPIEIKNDPFPLVRKVTTVFLIAISVAALGAAVGVAAAALLGASITLITAAAVGGTIGLVAGLAIAFFLLKKELSPLQQYRLATFEQIAKEQPNLAELVEEVKKVFLRIKDEKLVFHWAAQHHALHDLMTRITLSDPMRTRKGLKEIWDKFLKENSGIVLAYPQGPDHTLDFSLERRRLNGENIVLKTEWLDSGSARFEKNLQEITALELDGDGWAFNLDANRYDIGLRNRFSNKEPRDRCILIRDAATSELFGILWFEFKQSNAKTVYLSKDAIHINYVARKSCAAQLHIGRALFKEFFSKVSIALSEIDLHVRAHNEPAKKLYENFGFVVCDTKPNYYPFPKEDGLVMRFDYQKYIDQMTQSLAV